MWKHSNVCEWLNEWGLPLFMNEFQKRKLKPRKKTPLNLSIKFFLNVNYEDDLVKPQMH